MKNLLSQRLPLWLWGVAILSIAGVFVFRFPSSARECDVTTSVGQSETFGIVATDPGDRVFYTINWDASSPPVTPAPDIQRVPASGTVPAGEEQSVTHAWSVPGSYTVSVTATDVNGNTSPASETAEPILVDTVCVNPDTQCLKAGEPCKDENNCSGHYSSACVCIDDVVNDSCPLPLPKIRGDLNCDHRVGVEDLGILTHFWGQKTVDSQSACRNQLDSIGYGRGYDGIVDANDAELIAICWGQTFDALNALPLSDPNPLKVRCLYLDQDLRTLKNLLN